MKIKINNSFYVNFNEFSLNNTLDSVASTFAFSVIFDPKNQNHIELFRPLMYFSVEFFDENNNKIFTGTIINHSFTSSAQPNLLSLSGYSTTGILEDCTIPYSAYPLESLNVSLKEVTEKIISKFGLKLVIFPSVERSVNIVYEKTVSEPSQSVKEYLSKLAAQRNILMSHDSDGNLVFFRPDSKSNSKKFYNKENVINMSFSINGQGLHSELTIIRQPDKSNSISSPVDSLANKMVRKFRPNVNVMSSGENSATNEAVQNFLSSELKNITLSLNLKDWDDNIFVGDIVDVQNDECFIFKRTRFMVESTSKNQNSQNKIMSINLVLPETYSGTKPENIFL